MNKIIPHSVNLPKNLLISSKFIILSLLLEVLSNINLLTKANAQPNPPAIGSAANECKRSIGMINRAQQEFFREHGEFAPTLRYTEIKLPASFEKYYLYGRFGRLEKEAIVVGKPIKQGLKGCLGGVLPVYIIKDKTPVFSGLVSGICESNTTKYVTSPPKVSNSGNFECPIGYHPLE